MRHICNRCEMGWTRLPICTSCLREAVLCKIGIHRYSSGYTLDSIPFPYLGDKLIHDMTTCTYCNKIGYLTSYYVTEEEK